MLNTKHFINRLAWSSLLFILIHEDLVRNLIRHTAEEFSSIVTGNFVIKL